MTSQVSCRMSFLGGWRDQEGDKAPWAFKSLGDTKEEGETCCGVEASSPPSLPCFKRVPAVKPDRGEEQTLPRPPPTLIQASSWLNRETQIAQSGQPHTPRSGPCLLSLLLSAASRVHTPLFSRLKSPAETHRLPPTSTLLLPT